MNPLSPLHALGERLAGSAVLGFLLVLVVWLGADAVDLFL